MVRDSMTPVAMAASAFLVLGLGLAGCQSSGSTDTDSSSATGSEFDQGPLEGDTSGEMTAESLLGTVYFDFDRSNIREDAKPTLRANATAIQDHKDWGTVTVEGHCDERGSEEYNLALGERRANGVKRYLADLGVSSSRMRTVSFGEAKPSVMGHDESAWRYNRRSEFKVSAH